jgi:signal peptidase I
MEMTEGFGYNDFSILVEGPPSNAHMTTNPEIPQVSVTETESRTLPNIPAPAAATGIVTEIRGWARDVFFAIGTAILIVVFLYQPVKVEGTSMLPELVDQERIFVNKFVYRIERIQRKDIVVFWYPLDPTKSYIKRVVGMPGDVVEIRRGIVYINDKPLDENYILPEYLDHRTYPPVYVEPGHYYVLGDHRNQSNDSRMWGLVPEKYIYGKAVFRYWPIDKMGSLD